MNKKEELLRQRLVELLGGKQTRMSFEEAVADFPVKHINTFPPNIPYPFWHLLEHIRLLQTDVLDFIKNPNYRYIPDSYWPPNDKRATKKDWDKSVKDFQKDLKELKKIVKDPNTDLFQKIKWGSGQDIYREILVVGEHNAYHIGELAILRQVIGAWPKSRED